MIARITGVLEQLEGGAALVALDEGGLGLAREVLVPAYLADRLSGRAGQAASIGAPVTLHTLEYLESQNQGASFIPRLIGFASTRERDFFELLTSVKGLGNKRALRAMTVEPGSIARSIHERDTRALQRLPEIGPKLAELIVHELRGKVERFVHMPGATGGTPATGAAVEAKPGAGNGTTRRARARAGEDAPASAGAPTPALPPVRQTVETLIALGEAPAEAERLVARAIDRARGAGAALPTAVQELLTAAYAAR